MAFPRILVPLLCLTLASCITPALREARHEAALPGHEISRTPQTLTGRKIANSQYDVWRFQGWLIAKDSPRSFDLYLPKNRSSYKASVREVTSAKAPAFTGDSIRATIDLRHTSRMLLDDPAHRAKTDLVIGESIASKGKNVSVGLREGGKTHHWYAPLDLEWVKRDKIAHHAGNGLYLLTVPSDILMKVAEAQLD
jgi:hypothetical protein